MKTRKYIEVRSEYIEVQQPKAKKAVKPKKSVLEILEYRLADARKKLEKFKDNAMYREWLEGKIAEYQAGIAKELAA